MVTRNPTLKPSSPIGISMDKSLGMEPNDGYLRAENRGICAYKKD